MISFLTQHSPLLYLTQSLWRDEVYSVFMAAKPISYFVSHLSFEPPLYYLLLHFWMKLFGMSEIAGRSLSFIAFAGATVVVIFWAEQLFKKHWLTWWLPLFFFLNPMLIYYSMELRTYGWYIFFATASLYTYSQKKWSWWVAATALGFYTHSFLIIVPFAQTAHYLFTYRKKLFSGVRQLFQDHFIRALLLFALLIAPWLVKISLQLSSLKSSWYYPVDINLVKSVLGNLFVGYEGTPWYVWTWTRYLSLIIAIASIVAVLSKQTRKAASLFIFQIFLPLTLVIGISFIKPLYVNRYMIAVTIAEVFVIALAIQAIKNTILQRLAGVASLLFILGFNVWYPAQHAKVDIRSTIEEVHRIKSPTDIIVAENPLIVFEAIYYSDSGSAVYLYNPDHNPFPWYVGEGLVHEDQMIDEFPQYPVRSFFIRQNGMFDIVYKTPVSPVTPAKRL